MTDEFAWHAAALKGERGELNVGDAPHSGFYRTKRTDKKTGAVTYDAIAYWRDTKSGVLRCHRNGREMPELDALDQWPFACMSPIHDYHYWQFIDTGQWFDNDPTAAAAAEGPEIDPGINNQNAEESLKLEVSKVEEAAKVYATIDSDEMAARAQTLRSAATSLKGTAQKRYESWSRPLLDEIETIRKTWFAIRDRAGVVADGIRRAQEAWEDVKRDAAKKAQAETDRRAAEHTEAVRKAEEANQPPPPPPPKPVAPNMPAPAARIKGASGRTASVTVANIITDIDLDKCFAKFRTAPELRELFMDLANKSMKAGICTAADIGAVIEEKSVVK